MFTALVYKKNDDLSPSVTRRRTVQIMCARLFRVTSCALNDAQSNTEKSPYLSFASLAYDRGSFST